jgi:predicted dehydrogenase
VSNAPAPMFGYDLPLPRGRETGIGIVGAGTIVGNSHLPAYAAAGFRVVAIADRDHARASALAVRFGIPRAYGSVDDLLADDDVAVVDIAVPPVRQPPIARSALGAGKHVLCHKPLALSLAEAAELVELAARRGLKLAVNQNARWLPGVRATANLLRNGDLGTPVGAAFDLGWRDAWEQMAPDWLETPDVTLRTDCVHHIDTCRFWFGEPEWVFATTWRTPGQATRSDSAAHVVLGFSDNLVATIRAHGGVGSSRPWAYYRVEGTGGVARGTYEQYVQYGLPVADGYEVELASTPDCVWRPTFPYTTVPHAFIATMAQLLIAVEQDVEAESSGEDNLLTQRLVEAAVASRRLGRIVHPDELHPLLGSDEPPTPRSAE